MNEKNELPKRKPTRHRVFDYSRSDSYFITICTQNRKSNLSTINVGEGSPLPKLSSHGKVADKWIRELPNKYKTISLDCYVIMPNHIHLLLSVDEENEKAKPSVTIDAVIGWLKYQTTKEINKIRNTTGEKIFQRSFYDHVVRNYEDYCEVYGYIMDNPARWQYDKLYNKTTE